MFIDSKWTFLGLGKEQYNSPEKENEKGTIYTKNLLIHMLPTETK